MQLKSEEQNQHMVDSSRLQIGDQPVQDNQHNATLHIEELNQQQIEELNQQIQEPNQKPIAHVSSRIMGTLKALTVGVLTLLAASEGVYQYTSGRGLGLLRAGVDEAGLLFNHHDPGQNSNRYANSDPDFGVFSYPDSTTTTTTTGVSDINNAQPSPFRVSQNLKQAVEKCSQLVGTYLFESPEDRMRQARNMLTSDEKQQIEQRRVQLDDFLFKDPRDTNFRKYYAGNKVGPNLQKYFVENRNGLEETVMRATLREMIRSTNFQQTALARALQKDVADRMEHFQRILWTVPKETLEKFAAKLIPKVQELRILLQTKSSENLKTVQAVDLSQTIDRCLESLVEMVLKFPALSTMGVKLVKVLVLYIMGKPRDASALVMPVNQVLDPRFHLPVNLGLACVLDVQLHLTRSLNMEQKVWMCLFALWTIQAWPLFDEPDENVLRIVRGEQQQKKQPQQSQKNSLKKPIADSPKKKAGQDAEMEEVEKEVREVKMEEEVKLEEEVYIVGPNSDGKSDMSDEKQ
jgi:hypothetical protein